jgi:hypothetical protein
MPSATGIFVRGNATLERDMEMENILDHLAKRI